MSSLLKSFLPLLLAFSFSASHALQNSKIIPLNSTEKYKLTNVKASVVSFKGKEGLRVEKEDRTDGNNNFETLVLLENMEFMNGTIELEKLFVHDSTQPTLIVNDLKYSPRPGLIGLWLHTSTLAHDRNLKITKAEE